MITDFEFNHMLYKHDPALRKESSERAELICHFAAAEFARDHLSGAIDTPYEWVKERYDNWIKQGYVSQHMPEKVKKILKK